MNVKYKHEVRFCGSVVMKVNPISSKETSYRLLLYEYTNKKIISIVEYNEIVNTEIHRVKCLPGNSFAWIVSSRPPNTIYTADPITSLKGCGKGYATKF